MTGIIMDGQDVAEIQGIGEDEEFSDITATEKEDPATMDFHIQMRGYTMHDFEAMVVHAAAKQIVGDRKFAREIEAKAVELANEKINSQLSIAMGDVMGITVQKRGAETVTLGQMIGMEGKDYLTQPVDSQGKVDTSTWGRDRTPRIAFLVTQYVREHFSKEIKAAMDAMQSELRSAIKQQLDATMAAERQRIAKALEVEISAKR